MLFYFLLITLTRIFSTMLSGSDDSEQPCHLVNGEIFNI